MQVDHHDLHHDFPEYAARIQHLKTTNAHFANLFKEYDRLDHAVRKLENEGIPTSDAHMEAMKIQRVHLKDELYGYLSQVF
jgi:uncharacterized protein